MTIAKSIYSLAAASLIACGTIASYAADTPSEPPGSAKAYLSDATITAKVKSALLTNKLTGITVNTDLGVVSLSGTVASEEVRQQVTKIAAAVDGVRGVDYGNLSIKAGS